MIALSRRAALLSGLATAGVCLASLRAGPGYGGQTQRIVSVGGTLTEIAFALGVGGRIVGADSTSTWPPETELIPKVGDMRRLSAEGILSLDPDLVLLAARAGPPNVIDQLRATGVPLAIAPEGQGLASVAPKIRFVGAAIDRAAEAEVLVARFERDMAELQNQLKWIEERPRVLFLISVARGAPMAAGAETAAEAMIDLARGRNAITGLTGYKPVSAEVLIAAEPEVVLLPRHVAETAGGAEAVLSRPDLAETAAARNRRVVVMDGLKLLGFGLRTPEAVAELARALHPRHAGGIVL